MKRLKFTFFLILTVALAVVAFSHSYIIQGNAFEGEAKMVELPSPVLTGDFSLQEVILSRRSVRSYADASLTKEEIANILWAASGVTSAGGMRAVPSAGALYPLTVYLVVGKVEGINPGVYRYCPDQHGLVEKVKSDKRNSLHAVSLRQDSVRNAPASLVICADYKVTTRRYGQRGKRYVDIEVGHMGQNVYLQAESLGLATVAIGAFDCQGVKEIISTQKEPLYIMPLGRKR